MPDSTTPLTPQQQRIYLQLERLGGPAAYFKNACGVLATADLHDAATPILGNLYREVESALRDVLLTLAPPVPVPPGRERATHKSEIKAILAALGIDEGDPRVQAWLQMPGKEGLQEKTHRRGLRPPRPLDPRFWHDLEGAIAVVLDAFEARYLAVFTRLDSLLVLEAPTGANATELATRIPQNHTTLGYFFSKLGHPAWVRLLRAEGLFAEPPAPVKQGELGYSLPPWPALDYLARMATNVSLHDEAETIALEVPDTDNAHVHRKLYEIAVLLPPDRAARLAARFAAFLERPFSRMLSEPVAELVVYLAANGRPREALALARSALSVLPVDESTAAGGPGRRARREPRMRFDQHGVEEFVKSTLPPLVDASGLDAVDMYADALHAAVVVSNSSERVEGDDLSYVWRPAVEDHEQNRGHDVRGALVDAVRDATLRVADQSPAGVRAVIQCLRRRPWKIIRRIEMHVATRHAAAAPEVAEAFIGDRACFDDICLQHEYYAVSAAAFGRIDPAVQARVLRWITDGPDVEAENEEGSGSSQDERSEGEALEYREIWQRDRLLPIAEYLDARHRALYDSLVRRHGVPRHPDFPTYVESGWGDRSPVTDAELTAKAVPEVLALLKSWRPSDSGPFGPSRRGLAGVLRAAVSTTPAGYAAGLADFQGLPVLFQEAVVEGFAAAAEAGAEFPWSPVLDYCKSVLSAPASDSTSLAHSERFAAPKLAVVRMLESALTKAKTPMPHGLRENVWSLLRNLAADEDPSEDRDESTGMDAFTLSLNCTRGRAMHAVFAYAEWVQSANPPAAGDPVRPLPGEVKSLLEERLSSDPSAAVRSVIGHAFPYLWHVEPTWAEEQRERIFSTDAPGVAAWEAFVLFREPPRPSLFRALRPLYLQAVRRAVEARDEARRMQDPHEHLAWHLMPPCWGGELAFGQPDGLLDEFFSRAPVALRAHALESVGRALTNTEGAVPEPELQRILNLWTRRRTTLLATDTPTDSLDELVSFGWWFASEKLDEDWALSELIAVIGATRKVEPDHFVLEHLAKTVVRRPMPSLRALRLLVEGASDPWFVDAHAESIESIIRAALRGSGESRAAAAEFVNRLAARGSLRFRGLLAEPDLGAEEGED